MDNISSAQTAYPHIAPEEAMHVMNLLQFDNHGFLVNPKQWSVKVALAVAEDEGIIPMTPGHWVVIRYLRDRYLRLGAIPPLRNLCRGNGLTREEFKELFGSCYQAWRIAGLPDPGEDVRNHMR
jgi:tRNA 2-thiouridine synthesizing protein E